MRARVETIPGLALNQHRRPSWPRLLKEGGEVTATIPDLTMLGHSLLLGGTLHWASISIKVETFDHLIGERVLLMVSEHTATFFTPMSP